MSLPPFPTWTLFSTSSSYRKANDQAEFSKDTYLGKLRYQVSYALFCCANNEAENISQIFRHVCIPDNLRRVHQNYNQEQEFWYNGVMPQILALLALRVRTSQNQTTVVYRAQFRPAVLSQERDLIPRLKMVAFVRRRRTEKTIWVEDLILKRFYDEKDRNT